MGYNLMSLFLSPSPGRDGENDTGAAGRTALYHHHHSRASLGSIGEEDVRGRGSERCCLSLSLSSFPPLPLQGAQCWPSDASHHLVERGEHHGSRFHAFLSTLPPPFLARSLSFDSRIGSRRKKKTEIYIFFSSHHHDLLLSPVLPLLLPPASFFLPRGEDRGGAGVMGGRVGMTGLFVLFILTFGGFVA